MLYLSITFGAARDAPEKGLSPHFRPDTASGKREKPTVQNTEMMRRFTIQG
jgi:hypothetical protein